ncbi:hypothetical protein [Amycolatopsis sp. NPDC001319]|uniref:hypothetical protein n=1 Tax=unclassified Amycolatopsis TaxID=2618356 RepID=UPI0036C8739F
MQDEVLDGEGDAGERPVGGVVQRCGETLADQPVHRGLNGIERRRRGGVDLVRVHLAGADQLCEGGGVEIGVFVGLHGVLRCVEGATVGAGVAENIGRLTDVSSPSSAVREPAAGVACAGDRPQRGA